jgi:hypothetical protein
MLKISIKKFWGKCRKQLFVEKNNKSHQQKIHNFDINKYTIYIPMFASSSEKPKYVIVYAYESFRLYVIQF